MVGGKVRGLAVVLVFPAILACGGSDGGTLRSDNIGTDQTTSSSIPTTTGPEAVTTLPPNPDTTRGQVVTTNPPRTTRTTEPSD